MKIPVPSNSFNAAGPRKAPDMREPMKLHASALPHYLAPPPGLDQVGVWCPWTPADDFVAGTLDDGYDSSHSTSCGASTSEKMCSSPSMQSEDASIDSGAEETDVTSRGWPLSMKCSPSLDQFSFPERANIILPVIAEWGTLMGLTRSGDSIVQLQRLISEHPATQGRRKNASHGFGSVEINNLRLALRDTPLQELIAMLKPEEAPPSVQISIETLACEMQLEWAKSKERKQRSNTKRKHPTKMKRAF